MGQSPFPSGGIVRCVSTVPQLGATFAKRSAHVALSLTAVGSNRAAAQSTTASCGDVPQQFQHIAELLTRVQQLGVALGLLFAVFMYIICGIYYMRGTPEAQERARRIFINTTIGLVIVLAAGGFVEFVNGILCPGGG